VGGPARLAMAYTLPQRFVRDRQGLDAALAEAKQMACPHCRRTGMVVGHGLLMGYAECGSERVVRGPRLLCSQRFRWDLAEQLFGRQLGCGPIFIQPQFCQSLRCQFGR
jgi:hypothetical protein